MFGQVGFGKWKEEHYPDYLPVLIQSPYDIPPGKTRDYWTKVFRKYCQKDWPLSNMPYLVYWYGTEHDLEQGYRYSLLGSHEFCLFEDATPTMRSCPVLARHQQGGHLEPNAIQDYLYRAMFRLQQALTLEPSQRRGDMADVREGYDLLSIQDAKAALNHE